MKITVIIPIYNTEKYLRECIESVINQTYSIYEIMLIDDGSTDNSIKISHEYAQKYKNINVIHTSNKGVSAARNMAVERASGDYIMFVDSDDWLELDMVEELVKIIEDRNVDMSVVLRKSDIELEDVLKIGQGEEMLLYMLNIRCIEPWGKLYKKDIFNNIKYREGRTNEDLNILPDIVFKCNSVAVRTIGRYNYRQRENSIMEKELKKGGKTICFCCLDGIEKMERMVKNSECKKKLEKWYFYHILWYFYNVYCNFYSKDGMKNIAYFYKKTFFKYWSNEKVKMSDKFRFTMISLFPNLVRKYNIYRYG